MVAGYNCFLGRLSRAEEEEEPLRRMLQGKNRIFCNYLSKSEGNMGVLAAPLEPNQKQALTVLHKHSPPADPIPWEGKLCFPIFQWSLGSITR